MMKVVFRVDASRIMGTGHVMRCLSLAGELALRGAGVTFVCQELLEPLAEAIALRGFELHRLGAGDWEEDACLTERFFQEQGSVDWLVVDHYGLDRAWESRMRPYVGRILVIDDLADRAHDCDALLDQNYFLNAGERYRELVPEGCVSLLGPRYALLRPEFAKARADQKRDGTIRRVLIGFGGSDPTNETLKTLPAIRLLDERGIAVDIVVGAGNPNKDAIATACGAMANVTCHLQVADMAALMTRADLAVGAGGTTTWERACLGLPALVISVAENQERGAWDLAQSGYHLYLGRQEDVTPEALVNSIATFLQSPSLVRFFSEESAKLVDGKGAQHVAQSMLPDSLKLRLAVESDSESLYVWRNSETNRLWSFNPVPISFDDHQRWYAAALENPCRILLVGEDCGEPVGVLRYDLTGDQALVSIYLVPGKHGHGYGPRLLRAGSAWLREYRPQIRTINAEILSANRPSIKAFTQAGYVHHASTYKENLL